MSPKLNKKQPNHCCFLILTCTILGLFSPLLWAQNIQTAGKNANVSILSPSDGAVLAGKSEIQLRATRTTLMPARIVHPDSGHFHILINPKKLPQPGETPSAPKVIKLTKGESRTTLDLPPGQHTIQAVLVDHLQRAHKPVVATEAISVTVVAPLIQPKAKSDSSSSLTKKEK